MKIGFISFKKKIERNEKTHMKMRGQVCFYFKKRNCKNEVVEAMGELV